MAEIVLVNPRFEVSYFGIEHALPLLGKCANLPVAGLPLLAALTPPEHHVWLQDESVEPLDYDRLARADIVGLTGMIVQRARMREILTELKKRGAFTVVGGPWVTVQEDYFDGLTDVVFVGEAERTWPRFLEDWQHGTHQRRYEQDEPTDMTSVPPPCWDLLDLRHYMFGSVQFSRGCPFQCEFCDIIITFGRRPRLKAEEQVLRELDALADRGMELVFIVDDNLVGNKKAIKEVLRAVVRWQQRRGYPLAFFTEASIDLAEDQDLMRLMVEANVHCVFVGIESTNEASLRETRKFQNVGRRSLVDRVRAIQHAGLDVWCGMIVGFDHDDATVFAAQTDFLREARVLHASAGMLYAIPKTPLHHRLVSEGRIDVDEEERYGTNVIPLRMSRAQLRDGYIRMMLSLHDVDAYFGRLEDLFLRGGFEFGRVQKEYWRRHARSRYTAVAKHLVRSAYIFFQLMRRVSDPALRREYRRRLMRLLKARRDPAALFVYLVKCALHYHHHTMVRDMAEGVTPVRSTF